MKMQGKPKIREMIVKAKEGDDDSFALIVQRFNPVIQKYARWLGNDEAYSDLVLWIMNVIARYRPKKDKQL